MALGQLLPRQVRRAVYICVKLLLPHPHVSDPGLMKTHVPVGETEPWGGERRAQVGNRVG